MSKVGERVVNNPIPIVKFILIGLLFILFIGIGVSFVEADQTVHFSKNMRIDYGSKQNTITLIEKIGHKKVTKGSINEKENSLKIGNVTIKADKINTKVMGVSKIKYQINGDEQITKYVEIKDISSPKIKLKKKNIKISEEKLNTFNIEEFYSVQDNYSKPLSIAVTYSKDPTNLKVGKNKITITAIDEYKNETRKEIVVDVKPKKESRKESEENKDDNTNSSQSGSNNTIKEVQPPVTEYVAPSQPVVPSVPVSVPVTAPSKKFYTRDYNYDLAAMQSDCINYGESMVSQGRANGYDYFPFVEGDNISGYEIVFN